VTATLIKIEKVRPKIPQTGGKKNKQPKLWPKDAKMRPRVTLCPKKRRVQENRTAGLDRRSHRADASEVQQGNM